MSEPLYTLNCVCTGSHCQRAVEFYEDSIVMKTGGTKKSVIIPKEVMGYLLGALDQMTADSEKAKE